MAKIVHYAALTVNDADLYGTAELIGDGYLFRQDGAGGARFIRAQDVNHPYRLMLFGRVDVADAQYIDDELRGGPVGVCLSREEGGRTMTTTPFTDALQSETATLQAQHPILAGGLDKAFTLVASGAVFPLEDGRTAHVRSQSDPTVSHLVNGTCDCKATQYQRAPCAHRLAWRLYQRVAGALLEEEERWEPTWASQDALNGSPETGVTGEPSGTSRAPTGLPEAPASVNVRLTIAGREVQWTLRDHDEARLAGRLEALLARYPVVQPPVQASSTAEGWCRKHGLQMTQTHKDGRSWWSHRLENGSWCKGR